jgi:hypothetical protein
MDDPDLDELTRRRLIEKRAAEARRLRRFPDDLLHFWISKYPQWRRCRAEAAKGYPNGHVWPPIPPWVLEAEDAAD